MTFSVDYDPYDLTGARETYRSYLEDGVAEGEARDIASLVALKYAENTVRALTRSLGPYLRWCEAHHLRAIPADATTIGRFLNDLTQRGRLYDGKPLAASTMRGFRFAVAKAHTVAGHKDPFQAHPDLAALLLGYERRYSRPQIQAHAVRIGELAALIAAAGAASLPDQRDNVILTVVADLEVGMNHVQATRWTWEGTRLAAPDDRSASTRLFIDRPTKGFDELAVPNRIAAVLASDFSTGEMPLAARLCGTASLRALATSYLAIGRPLTGPVLTTADGTSMSNVAVRKAIRRAARKAGVAYAPAFAFDERVALVEAAAEPAAIGARDAAIMAMSWWTSTRRSEVAALNKGDIGEDSRGRGLIVLIRKSKGNVHGDYVPVPYAVRDDVVMATDLRLNLHRWLDVYARLLGRPLRDDDPLFVNLQNSSRHRLSQQAIGDVVKRWAQAAGVRAELGERISSHGFRAGYATEWLASGRPAEPLAKRQRRKSTASVLGYFRLADPFEDSLSFVFETPDDVSFDLDVLRAQTRRRG